MYSVHTIMVQIHSRKMMQSFPKSENTTANPWFGMDLNTTAVIPHIQLYKWACMCRYCRGFKRVFEKAIVSFSNLRIATIFNDELLWMWTFIRCTRCVCVYLCMCWTLSKLPIPIPILVHIYVVNELSEITTNTACRRIQYRMNTQVDTQKWKKCNV